MLIKNGLVFSDKNVFEPLSVIIDNGLITGILPGDAVTEYSGEVLDASGCYVLPGLCDVHLHGAAGADICDGEMESIKRIAEYELSQGVTSICPATMTLPDARLIKILKTVSGYQSGRKETADIVGIHLEGPFISHKKKGAQKEEYIQMPDADKLMYWQDISGGMIRLVTIAPELPGAVKCISECKRCMRFSLGHTICDYDTARAAFDAGADHVTHLYNAMMPFDHREPGLIGAAFDLKDRYTELICDGVHISPTAVRTAFEMINFDRLVLISDSMEATGMADGKYHLGGQRVNVTGNKAILDDGTIAGSVTSLYKCMLKAVDLGIPLESAVAAATINPCRSIGIDSDRGSIEKGKKAHFVLLDKNDLSIKRVIKE